MSRAQRREEFLRRIRPHQGVLRRLATVHADSIEDRRDLTQEILLQLWRSFPSYRGEAAFSTWMYRVALNTALLGWRNRSRRPEGHLVADARVLETLPAQGSRDETVHLLYASIRALPAIDRVLVALWLEGHSYQGIAEITGLGRSNVSVRLVRLKERLRASVVSQVDTQEVGR